MNIKLVQKSATAVEVVREQYEVIVDRPVENGGGGQGIVGGKYLLIGIGGCFCSTLLAAAKSRDIIINGLTAEVTANLSHEGPPRFTDIEVTVGYISGTDNTTFGKLIIIAEKGCAVINTIKNSTNFKVQLNG